MSAPAPQTEKQTLLDVRRLVKHFPVEKSDDVVQAVDGVSFSIRSGETLGLVGESGCGKSTVGRCLLRLQEPTSGEVYFEGRNILDLGPKEMRDLRREVIAQLRRELEADLENWRGWTYRRWRETPVLGFLAGLMTSS